MRGGVPGESPTEPGRPGRQGGREQSVLAAVAGAGHVEGGGGAVSVCHWELGVDPVDTAEASSEASQDIGGSRHGVFCHS